MTEYWRWLCVLLVVVVLVFSPGCRVKDSESGLGEELDIYVAGYLASAEVYNVAYTPCYWKDGERIDLIPLGATDNISVLDWPRGISGFAHSVFVDGDDVYVAGYVNFEKNWNRRVPCYWKNGNRLDLDVGDANEGCAYSIFVANGEVYACGHTYNWATRAQVPCYWKNGIRIDFADGANWGRASSIFISHGGIYISGHFWKSGFAGITFGYWRNGAWTELFSYSGTDQGGLDSVVAGGDDVYAAGWTDTASTQNVPSYWKNGIRTNLSVLDPPRSGRANATVLSGSDLYVAGWTKSDLVIAVPCFWKNGVRTDLSVLVPDDPDMDHSSANSIRALGSNVYVAGETYKNWLSVPCYWRNGVRTDLSVGREHMHGYGRSIFVTGK